MRSAASPLQFGTLLGLASGALEVAVRSGPQQGLSGVDALRWLGIALLLNGGLGALLGLVVRGPRRHGLIVGVLLAIQAGINYRFEWVLNNFLRDPKVWGGMLLVGGLSLLIGWISDEFWRRIPLILLGFVSLAGIGVMMVQTAEAPAVPHRHTPVLVVSMDTTRFDHLSAYGYPRSQPNLDRLAREGAVFTQAIAEAPITEPSHLAMFTGIAPYHSGVVTNGTDLGDRPALLWRSLEKEGWRTAGFVAGFPLHGKYGWKQGMSVWDDDFGQIPGMQSLSLVKAWNQVAVKEHALRERSADRVLARAVPWLSAHRDEDFFAFVHFYDAHGPYDAPENTTLGPPPTDGTPLPLPAYWPAPDRQITDPEWLKAAYDLEIDRVDQAIGRLLESLGPRLDDTIVVVTADHGESLGEHQYFFDHGDDLYDPSLRVPLFVRWPGHVKAGTRVTCQVGGVDLTPTLLELLGIQDDLPRDGLSRVQELSGGPCRERPVLASTVSGRLMDPPPIDHVLRGNQSKVYLHADQHWNFFDLAEDPGELVNRSEDPRAAPSQKALLELLKGGTIGINPDMDAETQEALRSLGYLHE